VRFSIPTGLSICLASAANASVVVVSDFAAWQLTAGPYSTIDFTGYPTNTFVTDQYSNLGVTFVDPDPNVVIANAFSIFPQDGSGINGVCTIDMVFAAPITTVAFHHPGVLFATLYSNGQAITASMGLPGSGVNWFQGLVSDQPFDRVKLTGIISPVGPCDDPVLDNLYFSTIPAPGGAGLVAALLLVRSRRRTR
jgi:hypothetical protein